MLLTCESNLDLVVEVRPFVEISFIHFEANFDIRYSLFDIQIKIGAGAARFSGLHLPAVHKNKNRLRFMVMVQQALPA
jgi:hypothetical protein